MTPHAFSAGNDESCTSTAIAAMATSISSSLHRFHNDHQIGSRADSLLTHLARQHDFPTSMLSIIRTHCSLQFTPRGYVQEDIASK